MIALLALACRPGALPPGGERPDILLISVDTLRADHLGAYGYPRPTSPQLDALAARGLRFAHARAPSPWTLPSHVTLLSGRLPSSHHVVDDGLRIGDDTRLLAEALGEAGYRSAAWVTSIFVGRKYGFDRGFDHFEDFGARRLRQTLSGELNATRTVDAALDFVREHPGEPLFLFLHLYDVHYPYDAPAPWDATFDPAEGEGKPAYVNYHHHKERPLSPRQMARQIDRYDEEILYVDHELGRLLAAFEAAGRPALVALTADHGEELGERGSWGHGHTLGPEQLHVPLLLAGPGVPAGVVVEEAVGLHDLAPTLAALAGATLEGDGLDLSPALRGEPLPARTFTADTSRFSTNRVGAWSEGLRLDWDLAADRLALYADPAESRDLAASRPEDARRLALAAVSPWGTPWEAEPGVVRSSGVILHEGRAVGAELALEAPGAFTVLPVDATLTHDGHGPWALAGGERPPEGAGLRARSAARLEPVTLSAEERARLEALGYLQEAP